MAGPSERLAVLTVVANRSYGGAERHIVDLSGELVARGHRVGCLFPSSTGIGAILDPGVEPFEVRELRPPYRFTAEFPKVIRAFGPDVVHLHSPRATFLGRLVLGALPRRAGRPAIVSTAHGWIPRRLALRPLYEAAYLLTARLDDVTIAVSRDTARRFGRWAPRLRTVPNGITRGAALGEYTASPERGVVRLGFVGRITQEKGFPMALAAWAAARDILAVGAAAARPRGGAGGGGSLDVELHVYGDGPLYRQARRAAARLARRGAGRRHGRPVAASGGVHFHGWVPPAEMPRVLSGLTALLLTSREEGLPYVALEAMTAGCPVIATAVGGLPELIEDGRTGWLIPPGDAERAAELIVTLATRPDLAGKVRRAAWERTRAYSVEAMVDGVEEAYRLALRRREEVPHNQRGAS